MTQTVVLAAAAPPGEPDGFFPFLRSSRLLTEAEVAALEALARPGELSGVFDALLGRGLLTPYQLDRVRRGEARGLVVGPYRVLAELGRGGGGVVYRARHAVMGREVALKVISPEYGRDGADQTHFRREVVTTTALRHPNVVLTFDANEVDGALYLAMELVPGPTLQQYVADHGPLPVPLACAVLRETARALDYAHRQGLVHRDIKPANVMLPGVAADPDGPGGDAPLVKVLDFGLARFGRQVTTISCPGGATLGTPAFMAPEQIRDVHAADTRSDLYSLGCTLYYALCGHLPFEGGSAQATLLLHLEREPRPVRGWRPDVPPGLAAVVHRLMAKTPADRYQTPAELIDALTRFLLSTDAAGPAGPPLLASPASPAPDVRTGETTPAPAAPAVPPAVAAGTLRLTWREWCRAVADTVTGGDERLHDDDYRAVYRDLMDATAARKYPGLPAELLDRARTLAEPWVTLAAIDRLDPAARAALYRAGRALDAELWPAPTSAGSRGWWVAVPAAVAAAWAAAAAWQRWGHDLGPMWGTGTPALVLAVPVVALFLAVAVRRVGRT